MALQSHVAWPRASTWWSPRYGVSTSVIAQAWNLAKPVVTSPLIGASKTKYIDDAIAALDLKLTADEMAYLEEPYVPHAQYGFR